MKFRKFVSLLLKATRSPLRFLDVFRAKKTFDDLEHLVHPTLRQGEHNCALVALAKVMPGIPPQEVLRAFDACCDTWPYGGVYNNEFNIVLRHLKIFDRFEYSAADDMIVADFLLQPNEVFILLLTGHFTVVKEGGVRDRLRIYHSCWNKVHCSWRLTSSDC